MSCLIDSETKKIVDCILHVSKASSFKSSISLKEVNTIAEKCDVDVDEVLDVLFSSGMMKVKK